MNAANPAHHPLTAAGDPSKLLAGVAVGLLAASIGALYTVFARWGIAHGLQSPDLTVLRFGVAGVLTLPVLWWAWRRDVAQFTTRWRVWALVALLAGTPFGLLMFGALQFAPASHAAVFPFTAMSVMGMLLGAVVLGERLSRRKLAGIAVVLVGLVLVSGVDAAIFPALAPGLAALMAWPVLGHVPTGAETAGLAMAMAMAGLILAVTAPARR